MMATLHACAWLAAVTGTGIVLARVAGGVNEATAVFGAAVLMLGAGALLFGVV